MNSMLIGGHLTHTHCIPCVMNSMYAWLHVCRVPCLPGSCAQGSMLTGFHLLPVRVLRVLPVMNSNHAGFHSCRTPTTPAPCRPGSMFYEFLCVLFLCVVNSMHAGSMFYEFHACWVPCMPGSMFYEFHVLWIPCLSGSMHAGFMCSGLHLL